VRLYSPPGNDLTRRFPLIVDALARLRSRSCIIDGEAVACDDNGVASFDLIRHQRANGRSLDWLKMKNADAPAVKREEEEEWGKKKRR
jgi:ATP-dependent DNA ligase